MKVSKDDLDERRAAILAAAETVFAEHGYAQTTMEAVAEKAGISKGSIYNYFQNKHDLYERLFARALGDIERGAMDILAMACPAGERVERILDLWFGRLNDYRELRRLTLEFWATAVRQGSSGMSDTFRQLYETWRSRLAALVAEGVGHGEFGELNPKVAASLILAILDGIGVQVLLDVGVVVDREFVEALKRAILAALRAGAGPAPNA